MYKTLSKSDKDIISRISQDIPLVKEPFKALADRLGIKEGFFLKRLKSFKENGIIRKFTISLNHRQAGFKYNVMAVWNVPEALVNKIGNLMASFSQVSHCYERKKSSGWNYNLYSMIHGKTKKECLQAVKDISKKSACKDYRLLFSSDEYKKTAVEY